MKPIRTLWLVLLTLGWLGLVQPPRLTAAPSQETSERHFETLRAGALAFTNVWVHRQTNFNILIRHAGGIHTIKLTDLPDNELAELKSQIGDLAALEKPAATKTATGLLDKLKAALNNANPQTLAIIGAATILAIGLVIVVRRRNQGTSPT